MVDTARVHDPTVLEQALQIKEKFSKAFTLFAKCHTSYNGLSYFSMEDINVLGNLIQTLNAIFNLPLDVSIKVFVQYYRSTFPSASFFTKLHFMEHHLIPWVKQWKVGCGIMGEQGAESLCASFNNTERAYNNMRDRVDRIKVLLQNHLQIQPNISSLEPPPLKKEVRKNWRQ